MQNRLKILENLIRTDLLPNCLRFLEQRKARGETAEGLAIIGTDSRDLVARLFTENESFEPYTIKFGGDLSPGANGWYRVDIDDYCRIYLDGKGSPPVEDLRKIKY